MFFRDGSPCHFSKLVPDQILRLCLLTACERMTEECFDREDNACGVGSLRLLNHTKDVAVGQVSILVLVVKLPELRLGLSARKNIQ